MVVGEAEVLVSRLVLGSEAVEKIKSVKSGKLDKTVEEDGGAVMLGGGTVFMR